MGDVADEVEVVEVAASFDLSGAARYERHVQND